MDANSQSGHLRNLRAARHWRECCLRAGLHAWAMTCLICASVTLGMRPLEMRAARLRW
jgi:hypothetical protein